MYSVSEVKIRLERGVMWNFLSDLLKAVTATTYQGQIPKGGTSIMKWGKYPEKFVTKFLGPKGIFILLTLAALLLLSGASDKWGL